MLAYGFFVMAVVFLIAAIIKMNDKGLRCDFSGPAAAFYLYPQLLFSGPSIPDS